MNSRPRLLIAYVVLLNLCFSAGWNWFALPHARRACSRSTWSMTHRSSITLEPYHRFTGKVVLPGSKSLSNRALLTSALCNGSTVIENLLECDDTQCLIATLRQLGVGIHEDRANKKCTVEGDPHFADHQDEKLYLGNAGTAMRPLAAVLCAGQGSQFQLDGTQRMRQRPIQDLVDALTQLGANIECSSTGCPPVQIGAQGLPGGVANISGKISSQYLSALLLAAPLTRSGVTLKVIDGPIVSLPYVHMTAHLMQQFGAVVEDVQGQHEMFRVAPGQTYVSPGTYFVEGDASAASYFLAGAAIMGGPVTVVGCGSNSIQGDVRFAQVLEKMGARVHHGENNITVSRESGDILQGVDEDCGDIPDAAMTLAIVGLFSRGRTVIRNVYNWRVKETERMVAMVMELRKLGATVEEGTDYLVVHGLHDAPSSNGTGTDSKDTSQRYCGLRGNVQIETYDDHRIAMCFALAACGGVPVTIRNPQCTAKTFPDYFQVLQQLTK